MGKIILTAVLLLLASSVHAAESIRWDSAALSYQSIDLDGDKFTGIGLSGEKSINDDFFITGNYTSVSDDVRLYGYSVDFDLNTLSAGMGYHYALSANTSLFSVASYERINLKASFAGSSSTTNENGFGLKAGARSLITENIQLSAAVKYSVIADNSDTGFSVSGMYNFTNNISTSISYNTENDIDSVSLSAIYFF